MRIAVVKKALGTPIQKDVDQKVKAALDKIKSMGAIVEEVSIPMHALGERSGLPLEQKV